MNAASYQGPSINTSLDERRTAKAAQALSQIDLIPTRNRRVQPILLNSADFCRIERMLWFWKGCARKTPQKHLDDEQIQKLRMGAMLSLSQFSPLADLDRATVSKAEKGGAVSVLMLHKIAATLGQMLDRSLDAGKLVSK